MKKEKKRKEQLPQQETLYTEEQVLKIIKMSRQTQEVEGIRFPIPKYTEQEIIDTINQIKLK